MAISMSTGLVLEGSKMNIFVRSFNIGPNYIILTLLILIFLFSLGNLIKLPTSATLSTIGVLMGISIIRFSFPNLSILYNLIIIWTISPFLAIVLAYIFYNRVFSRIENLVLMKLLSTLSTIFLGYTFGVNTLGLLSSLGIEVSLLNMFLNVISIFVGSIFLSAKLGEEIGKSVHSYTIKTYTSIALSTALILEIASNLSIPVPLTALIVLSLLGPVIAKKTRIINLTIFRKVIIFWIVTPLISLTISILLFYIFTVISVL